MRPQLIFACVLLLSRALQAQSGEYDVLIRNGRVLDGNGNPWIRADIAIKDGRFARKDGRLARRDIIIPATPN